ncbi:ARL14 effector protein-like isoform X2 [Gigantopelta aegis]|uniref:ARL14 effector protein-like isoform X2 n=1 Tax=Gigantopelta aegis TaxID=1735272 RepID=UPI001B88D298|nr:ARL14 effector protein-like isoform X2 [Gigantopelta aegis]
MEQSDDNNKITQDNVADIKQEGPKIDRITRLSQQKKDIECHSSTNNDTNGSDENDDQTVAKQLKKLSFDNTGKFMDNFDPERSAREMRKMNRKIYRDKVRANQLYDSSGKLLENSHDLCDCLDVKCPGCHFPCPKCSSEKCGAECRGYRRWTYDYVEVEGTNCVIQWPFKTE